MKLDLSDAEIEEMVRTGVALVFAAARTANGQNMDSIVPQAFLLADMFLDAVAKNDPAKAARKEAP
jgi:hypothetical protein